jgi:hypothetical protein
LAAALRTFQLTSSSSLYSSALSLPIPKFILSRVNLPAGNWITKTTPVKVEMTRKAMKCMII